MKNSSQEEQYKIEIRSLSEEDGGGYLATFAELGRMITGLGDTREVALADLMASLPVLKKSFKEAGDAMPAPEVASPWQDFSGRVTLRIPKMLHSQLDRQAKAEDSSLNGYMSLLLQAGATAHDCGNSIVATTAESDPFSQAGDDRREYSSEGTAWIAAEAETGGARFWEKQMSSQQTPKLPHGWQVMEDAS